MLNIVICDDNSKFLDQLEFKIKAYLDKLKNIKYEITRFKDVESLLKSNISNIDIILLDVQFPSMSGIEAAKVLRQQSKYFVLIFISTFIEYAPSGYQVNALRYILKEQLDDFFEEAMENALAELGLYRSKLSLKFIGYEEEEIYTDDIIYIESHLHEVYFKLVGVSESLYLYNTLDTIQDILPKNEFVRIHQSYLVNLKHFIDAKNYKATLTQGIELPISQKFFTNVKRRLLLYRGRI